MDLRQALLQRANAAQALARPSLEVNSDRSPVSTSWMSET
jgi:hypothetical protein